MAKLKRTNIQYAGKDNDIPIAWEEDGELVFNLAATEASDCWLQAARLQCKADAGDEKAAKELERMENILLYSEDEWEE